MLTERRFTLPLQALEPVDLAGDGVATLLLLNPTGGVLAGDRLETEIRLGSGSRVCLSTPSATRVYRSDGNPAVQRVTMEVGAGATLEWLPEHLIPSPGARLHQSTEVLLAPDATLLLFEAWATGRAARGEEWGFKQLDIMLLVRDPTGPLLRDRSIIDRGRGWRDLGGTEGFGYVAAFAALRPAGEGWEELAAEAQADLRTAAPACRTGVTTLGRGGLFARLLCPSAPALQVCAEAIWARCRRRLLGREPLALRKL